VPADPKTRVFLSYGRDDAREIAAKLKTDLTAAGFDVWRDLDRIRDTHPWDSEVEAGLLASNVVLFLLSPHGVRAAGSPGNSENRDSVCLDEIAFARDHEIPVVPVKVLPCETPLLIYRLQHIDFQRWAESPSTYTPGFERICRAIDAAVRGHTVQRNWGRLPTPWDFEPFLREKRRDFTGREWLFQDIRDWSAEDAEPALLVVGEPGIGKSAIVAALIAANPHDTVLAYHCCMADTSATLEPGRFVASLAAMLSSRIDAYAGMLNDPAILELFEGADRDPSSAFDAAVLALLHKLHVAPGVRRFLLIDALDEALLRDGRPTIVDVLSTRIGRLPPWLRIVATTRGEPDVLRQLRGLRAQILNASDDRNQDDVRRFIMKRLAEPRLRDHVTPASIQAVTERLLQGSAGNFLFVAAALRAVENAQLTVAQIETLSPGLSGLYGLFFDRLFLDQAVDFEPTREVLQAVAAAREPLAREELAAVTGLDPLVRLPPLLGHVASFVPARDGRYALFHKSLHEWLTGWDAQHDQPLAGRYHISVTKGQAQLAEWCWADYHRRRENASRYCLQHLASHLNESSRRADLEQTLSSFDWITTKLRTLGVSALEADYDLSGESSELRLVQRAIQASSHVLIADQRQLASQLTGRLVNYQLPAIQDLLERARELTTSIWLRPLRGTLWQPSGSLMRTLADDGNPTALAVSTDGRLAVSTFYSGALKIWDLETGAAKLELRDQFPRSTTVEALSIDDESVLCVAGQRLRRWDLRSGREVDVAAPASRAGLLGLTPDSKRYFAVSEGVLKVWDRRTGREAASLDLPSQHLWGGQVRGAIVTSDLGRFILYAYHPGRTSHETVQVWDIAGRRQLSMTSAVFPEIGAVAVNREETNLVFRLGDTIRVWTLEDGSERHVLTGTGTGPPVSPVTLTSDAARVVFADRDGLKVWDLNKDAEPPTLIARANAVRMLAITPDDKLIIAADENAVRVWTLGTGTETSPPLDHGGYVDAVGISLDGNWIISSSADAVKVSSLGDERHSIIPTGGAESLQVVGVTTGGRYAVGASSDGIVHLWDVADRRELQAVRAIAMKRVTYGDGGYRAVANIDDAQSLRKNAVMTPDGRYAINAGRESTLHAFELTISDLETGTVQSICNGAVSIIGVTAATPDWRWLLTFGSDNGIEVQNLETGAIRQPVGAHRGLISRIAVTPDGGRAVSVAADSVLILWDLTKGTEMARFTAESPLTACAITPDGRTLVAGDRSGRVHVLRCEG
jgi:WD40 repeat protein